MTKLAIVILTVVVGIFPVVLASPSAAPADHPLLAMMAQVPASVPESEEASSLSYVDYRANEQARAGVPTYESWAAWEADDSDARKLWVVNSTRLQSGPPAILQSLSVLDTMPEWMGFDAFDVDRALTFGIIPQNGTIYAGEFDEQAIATAHTARNYTSTDLNGFTLWCGAVGCENGYQQDLQNRQLANIFGGELGREFPFAVADNVILVSGSNTLVESMVSTAQGETPSLLDLPAYTAIAEASVQGDALLVQAQFYEPDFIGRIDFRDEVLAGYGTLPAYELVGFVDRQDGTDQLAILLAVYANEADAQLAASELTARLENFGRSPGESFLAESQVNGQMDEPMVYASGEKWVAVVTARYALQPTPEGEDPTPSGWLFRSWMAALNRGVFAPITITE